MKALVTGFLPVCFLNLAVAATCPPEGHSLDELLLLPETNFNIPDKEARNNLARGLLVCVGHPDPAVRDGVVYSAYATWLRGQALSDETILILLNSLTEQLDAEDAGGFSAPFAALGLSEVARSDRITPLFGHVKRDKLVKDAAAYLESVHDYRGYADEEGWRHGVAHGADLALQLVLNGEVTASQVSRLLEAVLVQVTPADEVFYTFGEPARLARPVFYAYLRGDVGTNFWDAWFASLLDPAPMAGWQESWQSRAGLARRHNLQGFLQALYILSDGSELPSAGSLKGRTEQALAAM